ncbi:hypothetical protein C5167_009267 [Papaver somniferum]|uniref:Uncharacterized protein n=1 Tax=Papaver somniferum TaxID=3469 RepID=A0A4Y7JWW7_PAPSO|nr:hypothetical protein C5167_009267 [Papaver somniferum]
MVMVVVLEVSFSYNYKKIFHYCSVSIDCIPGYHLSEYHRYEDFWHDLLGLRIDILSTPLWK